MRKSISNDQPNPKKRAKNILKHATNRNKIQDKLEEKNKIKVSPLNGKSEYNVFLIIGLKKDYLNRAIISFYYEKDLKFDYNILNVNGNNKSITGDLILIQIELDEPINELMIKISGYKIKLKIPNDNNYFCLKNIGYGLGKGSNILEVKEDIIFEEFLEYFYSKTKPAENIEIKQDMLKSFKKNNYQDKFNISKLQKFCLKNKLEYDGKIIIKEDPEIMREIPITDASPEYIDYIKLIKDNKIIEVFINKDKEEKFYEIILEQIKKITDLNSIFEIFPNEKINNKFLPLIHKKIIEIKNTIPNDINEKVEDIFNIFDNILYLYFSFNLEKYLKELLLSNTDIFHSYFKYLLNGENKIKLKKEMLYFILDIEIELAIQDFEQNKNSNLLIDNLLNSENAFSEYILKQINNLSFNEKDFYQKGISQKIILYNAIIKKNNNLLNKFVNAEGTYPNTIRKVKNIILSDFSKENIGININSVSEYETKISLIISEKGDDLLLTKLKDCAKRCEIFFNNVENILKYYRIFFPNSKKDKVELIKKI